MVLVALFSILFVVIAALVIFIIKNFAAPKRVDAVPRLLKQGKTQNAIRLCKQLTAKDSKNYTAHYYLGKAYFADGKNDLAILEYQTVDANAVFGEGINEVEFRREYAQILMKFNKQDEALKNYLLLTKQDPKNADNFFQAGRIYENQGRFDIALGFMQKTAMLDKKHAKAHAEIGMMLYRTKKFADAKREIDVAIKLSPDTFSSYYYLGKILKDEKDIPGAVKAFEKAQRDPEVKQKAIIERGSCYMLVNRYDNAALDFQRAIDLDKTNANAETLYARYFLAACYEQSRKLDKAIEQWEIIAKRNKNFRDVASKLAEYKDLQANDFLKDYLTSSSEEFLEICKNATTKALGFEVLSSEAKKWGCQLTGVEKKEEWMSVRKQVFVLRFYRDPEPIAESEIHEVLDLMKKQGWAKAFIFASSEFSPGAKKSAENRPLELIEKAKLESILSKAGA